LHDDKQLIALHRYMKEFGLSYNQAIEEPFHAIQVMLHISTALSERIRRKSESNTGQ